MRETGSQKVCMGNAASTGERRTAGAGVADLLFTALVLGRHAVHLLEGGGVVQMMMCTIIRAIQERDGSVLRGSQRGCAAEPHCD